MKRIYVVGTADTKGEELTYLAGVVSSLGQDPIVVDVGTRAPTVPVDVTAVEVASHAPAGAESVLSTDDRGTAMAAMGEALSRYITSCGDVAGVVGIGGGGGTSIITAGMRALPLGLPKLMVSTLASGDVAPFVDVSDITMMPAVTDLAGLNRLSRTILHNAGTAIAGMCNHPLVVSDEKPALGLTMFGVTTDAVSAITDQLKREYDCLVFHATGTGGRAMEKLVDSGMLVGVLDITTTEICDLLLGGVLSAGEDRLGAIARLKLPYVGSVGALDMVNFWAMDTVPEHYRSRLLHPHNPNVTLMRTTPEECQRIGQWIGGKLNRMEGPVRFMLPEKGVSALDREGGLFYDPEADTALFSAIEDTVEWTTARRLIRLSCHINDPEFAHAAVAAFREIAA
ncbi:MAG: Tm-1-like ATP-binding domain-containing protein [Arenicellales bacterium]|nr:Tm-1-like ATP-binding domain-containing protein [Arenicellales bacterium]